MGKKSRLNVPASLDFFGDDAGAAAAAPAPATKGPVRPPKAAAASAAAALQQIASLRKRLRIKVSSGDDVAPWPSWSSLDAALSGDAAVAKGLRTALEASEWYEPTAVQMQAVPALISRRDTLVSAPTGSGKTGAFLVPAAAILKKKTACGTPRCVIIAPTRELCAQIAREARALLKFVDLEVAQLTAGDDAAVAVKADIIVGTPLKIATLLKSKKLKFDALELIILDEADKLLEVEKASRPPPADDAPPGDKRPQPPPSQSFIAQLDVILAARPRGATTGFFSATLRPNSTEREIAWASLRDGMTIDVGTANVAPTEVEQSLVFVGSRDEHGKLGAMREFAASGALRPPALVFVDSAERASDLATELRGDARLRIGELHAKRSARDRDAVVAAFRRGDVLVLICTDLASRGLDFKAVNTVVNYDAPLQPTEYLHRIGRVGRNGRGGRAVTLYTEDDAPKLRAVANVAKLSGATVPAWLLQRKITLLENARDKRPDKQPKHLHELHATRPSHTAGETKRKRPRISTVPHFDLENDRKKRVMAVQGRIAAARRRRDGNDSD
ncbi:P-loop containing nucleoside triphosphate hydrolase protein [Pelagophyceae sp. CCMP2097]|nr:P-loop containing nucleoside triphosphate hydrolase protein [Pelagophyceae sp. CCMP2097]